MPGDGHKMRSESTAGTVIPHFVQKRKASRCVYESYGIHLSDLYAKKRTLGPRKLLFSTAISAVCNEPSSSSAVIGSILLPVVCRRYLPSALCRPLPLKSAPLQYSSTVSHERWAREGQQSRQLLRQTTIAAHIS